MRRAVTTVCRSSLIGGGANVSLRCCTTKGATSAAEPAGTSTDAFKPLVVPRKVHVRVRDPANTPPDESDTHTYSFDEGKSLMECLRDDTEEIDMVGACQGMCKCSTCHVYVDPKWVASVAQLYPPDDFELDLLAEAAESRGSSRLSCQITLTEELNGLEVEIPSVLEDARFSRMMRKPK